MAARGFEASARRAEKDKDKALAKARQALKKNQEETAKMYIQQANSKA